MERVDMRVLLLLALCLCASVLAAESVRAESIPVGLFTGTVGEDIRGQLGIDVVAGDDDTVSFTFTNDVGTQSSITDVYFASGLGTYIDFTSGVITDSGGGVAFSDPANPASVPGDWSWAGNVGFSMDSDSPVFHDGVNSGSEWVRVTFDLESGQSLGGLLSFMGGTSLTGRGVALHVQGIGDDGDSGWYGVVPEPTSIALLGLGLAGLAGLRRRRRLT